MVWKYSSTVNVGSDTVSSLWQVWRVWSDLTLMPQWDKDCLAARLEKDPLEVGSVIYITLKNKPEKENRCIITNISKPNEASPRQTRFHFEFSVPLAVFSFQYEAHHPEDSDIITLTHTTQISGLFSHVYGYALRDMIKEGCDHMSYSVPKLATTLRSDSDNDI